MYRPLTVSVSAARLSLFGANHRLPYQRRIESRTCVSLIFIGSRLSGRKTSLISSYGTSAVEPQKSQRCPTRWGSKTDFRRTM
jgi:hypothetical protein